MDDEEIDGVKYVGDDKVIDEVLFVDATDKGVEMADLEVKTENGRVNAYLDGVRLNKTGIVGSYTIEIEVEEEGAVVDSYTFVVVVYDPEGKFEF